jgi:hypothetical protein
VAISAQWLTVATFTTSAALYTVPTAAFAATAGTYLYPRDLVITNSGTATCYVSAGVPATGALTTSSFALPSGGSVILTQCAVPASTIIFGVQAVATTTSQVSIGYATNVAYI